MNYLNQIRAWPLGAGVDRRISVTVRDTRPSQGADRLALDNWRDPTWRDAAGVTPRAAGG